MKVVIHAGLPKTGSTALQQFLASNRDALRRQGVVYPSFGVTGHTDPSRVASHWLLAGALHDRPQTYHQVKKRISDETAEFRSKDLVTQLKQLFDTSKDASVIILSSEDLGAGNVATKLRNIFMPLMERLADSVHVVAYARNPLDHYASSVQHCLRTYNRKLPMPFRWQTPHHEQASRLKDIFGDSFSLRAHSRQVLVNGDIVDDFIAFMEPIAGRILQGERLERMSNASLSAPACAMITAFEMSETGEDRKASLLLLRRLLNKTDARRGATRLEIPASWRQTLMHHNFSAWNDLVEMMGYADDIKDKLIWNEQPNKAAITKREISNWMLSQYDSEYAAEIAVLLKKRKDPNDVARSLSTWIDGFKPEQLIKTDRRGQRTRAAKAK